MKISLISAAVLFSAAHSIVAQGQGTAPTNPRPKDARHIVQLVNWEDKQETYKINERITTKHSVAIRNIHFNFLRFEPDFSVEAKEAIGYRDLAKLWSQVAKIGGTVGSGTAHVAQSPFLKALETWRQQIATESKNLATYLDRAPRTVQVTMSDSVRISRDRDAAELIPAALDTLRRTAESLILKQYAVIAADLPAGTTSLSVTGASGGSATPPITVTSSPIQEAAYAQALFDAQRVQHDALIEKVQLYLKRSAETLTGRVRNLDSQKSGTHVTVTIRVKSLTDNAADTKAASEAGTTTVTYFVNSTMPVEFHAGPAYTSVQTFDIEKLQRPNLGDVFQQAENDRSDSDLIVFMSYMLTPFSPDNRGFGLTLGTGLADIGKRLYVGGTARFNERVFLTGGGFTQELKEGDRAIVGDGNLFQSLKNVRKVGWFFSVSFLPY
ncbi:MAG TPA: hypothetical protein VIP11_09705 [Gemmatimonadaceae bacterium]